MKLLIALLITSAAAFVGRAPAPRGGTTLCAAKAGGLDRRGFGASVASVGLAWGLTPSTAAAKDSAADLVAARTKQVEAQKAAYAAAVAKQKQARADSVKLANAAFEKERAKVVKGTSDKYPKTLGSGWRDTPEGAKLIKISGGTL